MALSPSSFLEWSSSDPNAGLLCYHLYPPL
jgi:hypothetical protein